jgi:RHS repeat-associated protein
MLSERSEKDSGGTIPEDQFRLTAPQITLPKGGGAITGIGEKFAANPVTGTGSMTVPLFTSPGRSGFGPQLSLSYDSGAGNGPFGFGWTLSAPSITRRTDKGLPKYFDTEESDIFILSGAEDLVPVYRQDRDGSWVGSHAGYQRDPDGFWVRDPAGRLVIHEDEFDGFRVRRYRPRIEGLFARIERWTDKTSGISHWRSISKDNITTIYGKRDDARVADPADATHVFTWLICESYDDKGNAIFYRYKPEDDSNVDRSAPCERNRLNSQHFAQRYIKNIRYGNRIPRIAGEDLTFRDDWLFEVVFDYGEHDTATPTTKELLAWPVRQDRFSLFRSTFDIRTYRLCRRVLMFHHFPDELNGTVDYLVRSTDFEYKESAVASFIAAVTQAGYTHQQDGSYLKKALPKLEFKYTEVRVDETVYEIDPESIKNLPYGVDGIRYQWVDLDSEGLTGVLTEQADAWYYKRNLGNGTFGALEQITLKPSLAALSGGRQQLLDLAGEGRLDLVQYEGPLAGFHERTADGGWDRFSPFKAVPNVSTKDPNVRFVDITGDGRPDILISEDTVFTWYESRAKEGFGPANRSPKSWDEERGPKLIFSDPTQSIFLGDMAGNGLSDIVRIRYSEVCYWPNLGYGRFGAKVTMGNAPIFESPDLFDPKRIHLADIDGSGNSDIIYIGHHGISLYFNQSGNFWSPPQRLSHFPRINSLTSITATDLLGNGTACLVWSSPLAPDMRRPMRYIDLMGGQKPHLLIYTTNNMGAETEVQYTASTKFYLRDRREGRPWVTKLPFPVHVIERVENRDLVSNTKLVSTYRYCHGYYDGVEREFRGFAHVEQRDVESVIGEFDLPPVVTKTWFHNGALLEEGKLEAYFKDPANHEFFTGDAQATVLPDTHLPPDLSFDEMREAARALKGSILRQEVYADDGSAKAPLPYSVSERSYKLTFLQPQGPNRHAVFFSHPSETIDYHYERNPADPRISHALTLAVDDYGNVLKSVAIGYQRRLAAFDEQSRTLATLTERQYTNPILEDDDYRAPLPAEVKTFELTAKELTGAKQLDFGTVKTIAEAATEIAYEEKPGSEHTEKRVIEQLRTVYRKNDLAALLPVGKVESKAFPGESYKLAFTPGLLNIFQIDASRAELTAILTGPEGGYRNLDGNGRLWIPSGRAFYSPNPGDPALKELDFAEGHFFLPHRFQDPFGNDTVVTYDQKYILLLISTRDAVGNETFAEQDYRVLQPRMVTDPNDNRTQARFDALGMLAGTALRGKATGPVEGDCFDNFNTDLTPQQIKDFFDSIDPRPLAIGHLGTATTRILYDLERVPVCAASIARETHVSDLAQDSPTKVQLHFVYSDGFGREAQTKVQAEPGPLDLSNPNSPVANPRWVGTGEKIYNNKGKPIRQYEPFFSSTPRFAIEKWGVSNTLFYDPVERVVVTLHPNHTFEKVVFDPWQQKTFDTNDTVTFDPRSDRDVGKFFSRLPDAEYLPTWYQQRTNDSQHPDEKDAAEKAAKQADTPSVAHFDTLGRTFLSIADNGKDANGIDQKYRTRTVLDIEGNQREVIDALDRIIMRYDSEMLGTRIHQASMEAGERWMLNDVMGKPIRAWNSRKYAFRTEYDSLRRPLRSFVRGGDPAERNAKLFPQPILFERTIYGDSPETGLTELERKQANLRTKVFKQFDGAGDLTTDLYDFKGNSLHGTRQFAKDYKTAPDWSQSPALANEIFTSSTAYDALNRAIAFTTPDKSVYRPAFNEANLLGKVNVNLRGASASGHPVWTAFVTNIDYNAKGQRTLIDYGNGAGTKYKYDGKTFRLTRLKTTRGQGQNGIAAQIFENPTRVQDLHCAYDPAGNITRIKDAALKTVFNANQQVYPACDYTYDPLYRLIEATGREHIGQSAFQFTPPDGNYRDYPFAGAAQQNNLQALRNYSEEYEYDCVSNFTKVVHHAVGGNWTRTYGYDEKSLIEPSKKSNRLSQTALPTNGGASAERYSYDAHGSITQMPHLPVMEWDFKDQLIATSRQAVNVGQPETTSYLYDFSGRRVRKVTERSNGVRKSERFYIGGFEVYREFDGTGAVALESDALHIMDDKQRIAIVETQTVDNCAGIASPIAAQRCQLANHLGSANLELDEAGALITYEEYSPYGCTTYQATRGTAELSLKRYRYTGKERDQENAFTYHGARYCAPWLGRWTSCDPSPRAQGESAYTYVNGNPISYTDPGGMDSSVPNITNIAIEEEEAATPSPDKALYVRAFENWQNALKEHEAGNAAYWQEQYETLRSESYSEFSYNYAKAIGAFYVIAFAGAVGGHIAASGAGVLGGGALVQATAGGAFSSLALEGSQHVLGKIGGYDRNISGEKFSVQSYLVAGVSGGASGLIGAAIGRFLSGGSPIVAADIAPPESAPAPAARGPTTSSASPQEPPSVSSPAPPSQSPRSIVQGALFDINAETAVELSLQNGEHYLASRAGRFELGYTNQARLGAYLEQNQGLGWRGVPQAPGQSRPDLVNLVTGSEKPFGEVTTMNPRTVRAHFGRWYTGGAPTDFSGSIFSLSEGFLYPPPPRGFIVPPLGLSR